MNEFANGAVPVRRQKLLHHVNGIEGAMSLGAARATLPQTNRVNAQDISSAIFPLGLPEVFSFSTRGERRFPFAARWQGLPSPPMFRRRHATLRISRLTGLVFLCAVRAMLH